MSERSDVGTIGFYVQLTVHQDSNTANTFSFSELHEEFGLTRIVWDHPNPLAANIISSFH